MQVKEVKPINFLFFQTETSVDKLAGFMNVAQELYQEALKHNLRITGPVQWHYQDFNPSKTFHLEIALPVEIFPEEYDGSFHLKRTENFRCVSLVHEGSWYDIPKSYARLMEFIAQNKLTAKNVVRELYINVDINVPEANTTEIQYGIA